MRPDARYVALAEVGGNGNGLKPPPHHGKPPKYPHPKKHKGGGGLCCGCLYCCCCCCCLFVFIFIVALIVSIIFLNPKVPSYSIKNLALTSFNVSQDRTLDLKMSITLRTVNPNTRIGIFYGVNSKVTLSFKNTTLGSTKLPSFYQGYGNVTTLDIVLAGKSKLEGEMQELVEGQKNGNIPLNLLVVVPIRLKVLDAKTRPITVKVNCTLVVDNFQPNKKIGIKSADYHVHWHYDK